MPVFRQRFILSAILLAMLIVLVRGAILTVGEENNRRANLAIIGRSADSLARLNAHMASLDRMTANIKRYNFRQIWGTLAFTKFIVTPLRLEVAAPPEYF